MFPTKFERTAGRMWAKRAAVAVVVAGLVTATGAGLWVRAVRSEFALASADHEDQSQSAQLWGEDYHGSMRRPRDEPRVPSAQERYRAVLVAHEQQQRLDAFVQRQRAPRAWVESLVPIEARRRELSRRKAYAAQRWISRYFSDEIAASCTDFDGEPSLERMSSWDTDDARRIFARAALISAERDAARRARLAWITDAARTRLVIVARRAGEPSACQDAGCLVATDAARSALTDECAAVFVTLANDGARRIELALELPPSGTPLSLVADVPARLTAWNPGASAPAWTVALSASAERLRDRDGEGERRALCADPVSRRIGQRVAEAAREALGIPLARGE